ncbi:MAG: hypothetical protein KBO59_26495 [Achromobacter sp.]|nr:hypothetical protein [Achromobacter sp.]
MNARYSLVSLAAALMFIAPASQAENPAPGATMAPRIDCQALKDMDYSTMDLVALRDMERACALQTEARVAQAPACGCSASCSHVAHQSPASDH